MQGFRKFILRGNVVDLAIAVVVGAAFGAVVTAMVKDMITPLLAVIGGVPDFSAIYFTVNNSKFMIGDFINALLSFILIAVIVYFLVVLPVGALLDRVGPTPTPPVPTRECPFCVSKVPVKATRCAFCTSELPEPALTARDAVTAKPS